MSEQGYIYAAQSLPLRGRWHGVAVTDEGLASPYGRGAGGGEGVFTLSVTS